MNRDKATQFIRDALRDRRKLSVTNEEEKL